MMAGEVGDSGQASSVRQFSHFWHGHDGMTRSVASSSMCVCVWVNLGTGVSLGEQMGIHDV